MEWARRPDAMWPLCAMAVLVPLATVPALGDQVVLPRLALTAVLTGAALACSAWKPFALAGHRWLLAIAGLFLLVTAASTWHGVDPWGSLLGEYQRYQGLLPLCMYVALMVAATATVSSARRLRLLSWCVVAGGVLGGCYAVLDLVGWDWLEWENEGKRAGGLVGQPNVLGVQLVVALVLAAGLALHERGWRRQVAAGSAGLLAAVLLLTQSRGAWVAAGASLPLFALLSRAFGWRQLAVGAAVGVLGLGVVAAVPAGRDVLGSVRARAEAGLVVDNQSTRLGLWELAVEMWQDRPLLGGGPDGYSPQFPQYRHEDQAGIGTANVRPESAHSFWFDQLANLGLLGSVALLAVLATAGGSMVRRACHGALPPLEAGILAATAAYFVAVTFSFSEAMTGWMPWLLLGAMAARDGGMPAVAPASSGTPVPAAQRVAVVTAGAVLALAGALLVDADWHAGMAERADTIDDAARHARTAAARNPLMPGYLLQLAEYEDRADDPGAGLREAHRANVRFAPTAYSLLLEARLLLKATPGNDAQVEALLTKEGALDPHNRDASAAIVALRAALASGRADSTGTSYDDSSP